MEVRLLYPVAKWYRSLLLLFLWCRRSEGESGKSRSFPFLELTCLIWLLPTSTGSSFRTLYFLRGLGSKGSLMFAVNIMASVIRWGVRAEWIPRVFSISQVSSPSSDTPGVILFRRCIRVIYLYNIIFFLITSTTGVLIAAPFFINLQVTNNNVR